MPFRISAPKVDAQTLLASATGFLEYPADMKSDEPSNAVTRMFPFVLRSGILLVGRETLRRSKGKLHFVLVARDASENVRAEVLQDFAHYPVVQHFTGAELENFFRVKGAKVVGFKKSGLAQSIYAELKEHRINKPVEKSKPAGLPPEPAPES